MKHLLIFFAALVPFLPDFGNYSAIYAVESISVGDKATIAFAPLLFLFAWQLAPTAIERCVRPLVLFMGIAAVSTATIPIRFMDANNHVALIGLLRLARFSGTVAYAVLALRLFADLRYRRTVIVGWCTGALLHAYVLIRQTEAIDAGAKLGSSGLLVQGNPASVALASLGVLIAALLLVGSFRKRESRMLSLVGIVILLGVIASEGRGGWIGLALGLAMLARRISFRNLLPVGLFIAGLAVAAQGSETVNQNLSALFRQQQGYSVSGDDAATELSDGARVGTWIHESAKLVAHPVLGFGFFHRGGASSLWWTGSHNFFLQMFLEAGLLGGGAMVWFFVALWQACRTLDGVLNTGAKAALIALIFGGMGGEYFYGGAPLYCIFVSLCMLAIPTDANAWQARGAGPISPQAGRPVQPLRSRRVKRARSVIPSAASASAPPSPLSTMQRAPST